MDTAMQSDKEEWVQLCRVTQENGQSYDRVTQENEHIYAKENGHSYAE